MILTGNDIKYYISIDKLKIRPIEEMQFQQNGVDLILKDYQFKTSPSSGVFPQFGLGETLEYLELPDDLMAFVQLRSTWARHGFLLPPTIVDAGFKGTLTLEIFRFTTKEVPIAERFVHLIFSKLSNPADTYNGKYQNQRGITGPIED